MCLAVVALDAHPAIRARRRRQSRRVPRAPGSARGVGNGGALRAHPGGSRPRGRRHVARRAARRPLCAGDQRARRRRARPGRPIARRARPARPQRRRACRRALCTTSRACRAATTASTCLPATQPVRTGCRIAILAAADRQRRSRAVERLHRHALAEARAHGRSGARPGRARRGRRRRRCSPRWPIARVAPDAALPATGVPLERERLLSSPFIVERALRHALLDGVHDRPRRDTRASSSARSTPTAHDRGDRRGIRAGLISAAARSIVRCGMPASIEFVAAPARSRSARRTASPASAH